jgi:FixJ family two-component response regulator
LITAYKDEKVVCAAKQAGVHDLIEKPFNTDNIEASLSKLLLPAWIGGPDTDRC